MIRNENVQKKAQRCYLHPRENAVGVCSVCNRPVCGKCSKIRERRQVCRNCSDKRPVARDEE